MTDQLVELRGHFRPDQKSPKYLLNTGKPEALTIFLGNPLKCFTTLSCPNKHYLRIPENENAFFNPSIHPPAPLAFKTFLTAFKRKILQCDLELL